jgi:hypothetical protein
MSNIRIQRKHQSAPADTVLDTAVKQAAEEIDGGRWIEENPDAQQQALEGLGLSLSMGTIDSVKRAVNRSGTSSEFQQDVDRTRDLTQLGRHPRVLEAIEKLKAETDDRKTPDEELEREWMLYEMTCLQVQGQKWEGQQRWEGEEAEEMRKGELLMPRDFCMRLFKVIGNERVLCPPQAPAKENPTDKSGLIGLYVKNPLWNHRQPKREYKRNKAAELMERARKLTRKCEAYFNANMIEEAKKLRSEVLQMTEAATSLEMEVSHDEYVQPELLRVASLQAPHLMTEWMIMHFNEYGVPTSAKYKGWRTALLTMIRSRAITEEEAHKAFPVGSGPAAGWYLEQLYRIRNPMGNAAEVVQ